jgi:hypothetical protein
LRPETTLAHMESGRKSCLKLLGCAKTRQKASEMRELAPFERRLRPPSFVGAPARDLAELGVESDVAARWARWPQRIRRQESLDRKRGIRERPQLLNDSSQKSPLFPNGAAAPVSDLFPPALINRRRKARGRTMVPIAVCVLAL